ncbi:MAG: ABC transporter permease [Acidimicrobiales bacterium]|jgi:ABC-2 type transport system permease protein
MTRSKYIRFEVLRSFRNRKYLILSLGFPVVLYLAIAGSNKHAHFDGISFPLYFMTGMTALGTMAAVIGSGAAIAAERGIGWTRQLRITPLTVRSYFTAKVIAGYLRATLTMAVMCLCGLAFGVRLSAAEWFTVIGLVLVALIPFTVLGIFLGHVLTADSLPPAIGGIVTLFSLLGGAYAFFLAKSGALFDIMKALPSYWLVQAGKVAFGGGQWPAQGWIVVAAWSVVLFPIALLAYQRDTKRV